MKLGFFSINILCASNMLQLSECGVSIPREIFFKIANDIVPNLLCPTHPKEIIYQDQQLKSYRLVSTTWRSLLDQRVTFEDIKYFLVDECAWPYWKLICDYDERLNGLAISYVKESSWLINQRNHVVQAQKAWACRSPIDSDSEKPKIPTEQLPVNSNQYRKIMKKNLNEYDYNGLLKLEKYILNGGFLNTYALIRAISNFVLFLKDKSHKAPKLYCLFEKLVTMVDFTDVFARLFERLILSGEEYSFVLLKGAMIDFRRFLFKIHWSFYRRVQCFENHMSVCEKFIALFFKEYKESFIKKDYKNKAFLYYLLLNSKDVFFKIQTKLLIGYIKGIEKPFNDYSNNEQCLYRKLFTLNFLSRFKNNFSDYESYLKQYFGYKVGNKKF